MADIMEKEFVDLLELQQMLKMGVESLFPNRVWVKAEVSAVKARSGGHVIWNCPIVTILVLKQK